MSEPRREGAGCLSKIVGEGGIDFDAATDHFIARFQADTVKGTRR